jgi:membrane-associated phospholipid phosphatase
MSLILARPRVTVAGGILPDGEIAPPIHYQIVSSPLQVLGPDGSPPDRVSPGMFPASCLDEWIPRTAFARSIAGRMEMFAKVLSWVGGPVARTIFVLVGTAVFWWRGKRRQALLLALSVGGAAVLNTIIKKLVRRHRPPAASADGASFPSGHTTGTLVFTGVGAYLVWRTTGERLLAIAIASVGLPVVGLVGLSRVALRDHYPGDVLGGYVLGVAWLAGILKLAPLVLKTDEQVSDT